MSKSNYETRFAGIARLYGQAGAEVIRNSHVCVIGIGGVGSWAAEALARSGIGEVTLIDDDSIEFSNTNRQIHTLTESIGLQKTTAMAQRMKGINPDFVCHEINDFITVKTYEDYLSRGYDYVIDAIDSIKFKTLMVQFCKQNKIPLIVTGGAGG